MAQINTEGDPKLTQIQLVYMGDNTVIDQTTNPANAGRAATVVITTGKITTSANHDLADGDIVFVDNVVGCTAFKRRVPYWVVIDGVKSFYLTLAPVKATALVVVDLVAGGTLDFWKVTTIGDAEELFCGGFSTSPYRIGYLPDGNYTGYMDRKPSRPTERNYDFGFMSELASFGKTMAECIGSEIVVKTAASSVITATSAILNILYFGQKVYFTAIGTTGLTLDKIYYIADISKTDKTFAISETSPSWDGKSIVLRVQVEDLTGNVKIVPIIYDFTTVNQSDALLSASVTCAPTTGNKAANVGKPCQPMSYYPMKRPKPALKTLNWYLDDIKHKIEGFASDITINFSKGEIATISYNSIGKFKELPSKATCPTMVDHYKNEYPKYMLRELEVYKGAFGIPLKVLGVEFKLSYPYWSWGLPSTPGTPAKWQLNAADSTFTDYFSFVCTQVSFGLGNSNILRGDMRENFGNTAPTVVDRGIGYSLTIEEQDAEGSVNIWELIQDKEPTDLAAYSVENTTWKGAPYSAAPKILLKVSLGDENEGEALILTGALSVSSVFDRGGQGVATIGLSGGAMLEYCETQDDVFVPGMPILNFI